MKRVLIHVEGETEETFVNEVLAPHLWDCGFELAEARLLGNARQRSRRGGIQGWSPSKQDLLRHLRQDAGCCVTTMVDYYALPQSGSRAWPGRAEAGALARNLVVEKAGIVETAVFRDVSAEFGGNLPSERFIPFVMMHEFEALLFSDCNRFAVGIGRSDLAPSFQAIREEFASPEEINDSPITAPSKRVEAILSNYQKPFQGNLAALEIGLTTIRAQCPHFDAWVNRLESLPAAD